ncbi:MAG: NAD(P)H-quinone oxidoreductase [Desulfobacterales bacterium]|nr:NAD(P)H-quinone oxidoreductase [Desulfobacterales bacterium]
MKAIIVKEPGGAEQLALAEVPDPDFGDNDVLLEVRAVGVNRADILQRKGMYPPPEGASDLLGLEVAGVVERVGPKCRRWKTGDRVFAVIPGGGYAQKAVFHESLGMPIPETLDFAQAAAVGEVFLTACQALFWLGEVKEKENVLIHAGASGVGTAAIQLAGKYGCRVLVTAGTEEKVAACRELGADVGIVYRKEDFKDRVFKETDGRGADMILDFIGASYLEKNLHCLAVDGRLVILALMGGSRAKDVNLGMLLLKRLRIIGSTLRSRSLDYRARLAEEFVQRWLPKFCTGDLKPIIDRVLPWGEAAAAHRHLEENRNIGKIVLTLE